MEILSKKTKVIFGVLVIVLISLEIYCAKISYENYGWWMPILLYFLIFLNLLPIILFLKNSQISSLILLVLISLIIVPHQLVLAHKYLQEREEAANITNYLYQQKVLTGHFPESIANYKFKFPGLREDFSYWKEKEDYFTLQFSVGTTSTSHFFSSRSEGKWVYIDD
ncbi:MAG: hypothetical protein QM737_18875 [Ferruginibacter sp.]